MQYKNNAYCILIYTYNYIGDCMKIFKIPSIPPTTSKSIRFPNDVIEEVEEVIRGKNCTFTAFVVEAVRVALENVKDSNENNDL